jgi:hypothetical protein
MSLETHPCCQPPHIVPAASSELHCCSIRNCSFDGYMCRGVEILEEIEIAVPTKEYLESLVRLALDAQRLFFAAASFHPEEAHLDHFFSEFLRLSMIPTPRS